MCRKSLLPSLLKVLSQNKHVQYPQNIFEVGDVVIPDKKSETGAKNMKNVCCVISDYTATYDDVASLLAQFLASMKIDYRLKKCEHASFIEGRVAEIVVKNKSIGFVGELHPTVLENWKLEMPVATFEIDVESLS
jgi:phenylalanyl-tRNA synthetase beta chain